jgi:hypothetical protein
MNKEKSTTLSRKKAEETLCFKCPDDIKTECTRLNNVRNCLKNIIKKLIKVSNNY